MFVTPTRVDLCVGRHAIGLDEGLEPAGELVGAVERGGVQGGLNHVHDGLNRGARGGLGAQYSWWRTYLC